LYMILIPGLLLYLVRGMGVAKVISLEDIRRYGGMHAVLVDGEIVAASENPAEAYRAAVEKHPSKKVIVTYIPTEESLIL